MPSIPLKKQKVKLALDPLVKAYQSRLRLLQPNEVRRGLFGAEQVGKSGRLITHGPSREPDRVYHVKGTWKTGSTTKEFKRKTPVYVHDTGAETKSALSFRSSSGKFKTVKILDLHGRASAFEARNVEKRFGVMKALSETGAPVVKPLKLSRRKDGMWRWEEEYGGFRLNSLWEHANERQREVLRKLEAEAHEQLREAVKKLGIQITEADRHNLVYDPVTGKMKFTDIVPGHSASDDDV